MQRSINVRARLARSVPPSTGAALGFFGLSVAALDDAALLLLMARGIRARLVIESK
jgi:hypothetical protein